MSDFLEGVSDPSNSQSQPSPLSFIPTLKRVQMVFLMRCPHAVVLLRKILRAPESLLNLMKSVLYAQALSDSCSGSYSASSSSSSQASSSTSTQSQAASSSQSSSTGPHYDPTIYPSGFTGAALACIIKLKTKIGTVGIQL